MTGGWALSSGGGDDGRVGLEYRRWGIRESGKWVKLQICIDYEHQTYKENVRNQGQSFGEVKRESGKKVHKINFQTMHKDNDNCAVVVDKNK